MGQKKKQLWLYGHFNRDHDEKAMDLNKPLLQGRLYGKPWVFTDGLRPGVHQEKKYQKIPKDMSCG